MKKIIALLMAISLVLTICGCSKENDDTKTTATPDEVVSTNDEVNNSVDTPSQYETLSTQETLNIEPLSEPVMVPDFIAINQNPELPTGCEITSLTMVLNHKGFSIDKCELADKFLEKGEVGSTNFYKAFVGSPDDGASFGCYAPVIADTANRYFEYMGIDSKATAVSGVHFSSLLDQIDVGNPVIVWGTQYCQEGHESVTWTVDGEDLTWITPEHCMVLVGYDNELVYIADPLEGKVVTYDMDLFISCFNRLYSQAVIIE